MNKNIQNTSIKRLVKNLLIDIGEDTNREGLIETPDRVARMYRELFSGYNQNPVSVMKTFNSNGHSDLVTVGDIDFYSLCEHHMIPFYGKIYIGYLPNEKILGLSKFARLAEIYARRLQVQERLTRQILDSIVDFLRPKGAIVHVEAKHLCMSMRGIKSKGAVTQSTALSGDFETNHILVDRFFHHINKKGDTT